MGEGTIEKGTDVFEELQEDVEKEIIRKTSDNYENISDKMEKVLQELNGLKEKNDEIWEDYDFSEAEERELSEKIIQQHLNTFRASMLNMTKSWRGWHRNFFNSSELIVPATAILNKGAKDMKTEISDLFKTFREIDISKLGDGDNEESEGVPRELES